MTSKEISCIFDSAINQINTAKSHWIVKPYKAAIELKIAKYEIDRIIKLITT